MKGDDMGNSNPQYLWGRKNENWTPPSRADDESGRHVGSEQPDDFYSGFDIPDGEGYEQMTPNEYAEAYREFFMKVCTESSESERTEVATDFGTLIFRQKNPGQYIVLHDKADLFRNSWSDRGIMVYDDDDDESLNLKFGLILRRSEEAHRQ